jgi:LPPG:FO 2-phospho-L-lactate transferase
MADACLAAIGVDTTATGVAGLYADVLDGWLVDDVDADAVDEIAGSGIQTQAMPLLMTDASATRAIAGGAIDLALSLRS